MGGFNKSKAEATDSQAIPVVRNRVAGIDLGSREHWVAGPVRDPRSANVRAFGTTTPQLDALVDWLESEDVESVAMESTGVYWIPIYEVLESRGFEVLLVNARQLKSVPGRKTDMQDCQWIQRLHSCGLLNGSFRPEQAICELRAIHRQLENYVAQRTKAIQWMHKALDQMNVQVHRAVSDITGETGMAIVRAIAAGERDPQVLATHRDPRCKKSVEQIAEHLKGTWRREHLFNLEMALRHYDEIQSMIHVYETRLESDMKALEPPERQGKTPPPHPNPSKQKLIVRRGQAPLRESMWGASGFDLTRIDGMSALTARTILSEVGVDLSGFPTERQFVSWLRLCPRTAISGGKPLAKKRPKGLGATRVKNALEMAALTLSRSKTALGAYFRRVARNNDGAVAVFATARKLATYVYRMLRYGQDYVDIGEQRYEERFQTRRLRSIAASAKSLGFQLIPLNEEQNVAG